MIKATVTTKDKSESLTVELPNQEALQAWKKKLEHVWGKPERWSFDPPEDGVILDSRKVEIKSAMQVEDSINEETGEVQAGFATEAEFATEYLLPAEYSIEETDITAELDAKAESDEALAYLQSTDWIIIRAMDAGEEIPEDVRVKRAAARLRVVKV